METGINLLGESRANERELIKNLSILRSGISLEAIHDIRVAIKKLQAYCDLLNELDEHSPKNDLPQTKSLFDVLGKHREWDIILKHLQKSPDDLSELCPLFVSHIHHTKEQVSYLIKNALDAYDGNEVEEMNRIVERLIATMTLHKVAAKSKNIIKEHVLNLGKVSIHLKKQLHHCRKSLKVIFYLINLFPPGTLFSKKQVKHLDAFLDKLGRWHDFEIVFYKIKNYRKDYLAKSLNEYEALKKIESDIKAKRDKLFYRLKPQVIINELKS